MDILSVKFPDMLSLEPSNSKKLSLSKFSQYLDNILSNLKDEKVCNLSSNYISDYYISIDFTTFEYKIPNNLYDKLEKCKIDTTIRFYIIPLLLVLSPFDSHANVLIIDNFNKTIELYEPHGANHPSDFDIELHIKNIIKIVLKSKIDMNFKNVHYACPIGFQKKQASVNYTSGHCVAWTLLFIHLKLINIYKTSDEIIQYLNNYSNDDIDLLIRKYITLVENQTNIEYKDIIRKPSDFGFKFKLSEREMFYAKNNIKNLVYKYISHLDSNNNQYYQFDDTQKLLKQFIIYSKFDFFEDIYFKTIESHFKQKFKK